MTFTGTQYTANCLMKMITDKLLESLRPEMGKYIKHTYLERMFHSNYFEVILQQAE